MPGHQAIQAVGALSSEQVSHLKLKRRICSNLVSRGRITHTSVKPCRHNDQLRIILKGNRKNNVEECHEVLWVPIAQAIPGNVDVEPRPLPLPHLVRISISAAGEEFSVIISDGLSWHYTDNYQTYVYPH